MKLKVLIIISLLTLISKSLYAQQDTAPMEPPFVSEESSGDDFTDEIESDFGVTENPPSIPAPPIEAFDDVEDPLLSELSPEESSSEPEGEAAEKQQNAEVSPLEDEFQESAEDAEILFADESAESAEQVVDEDLEASEQESLEEKSADMIAEEMMREETEVQAVAPVERIKSDGVVGQSKSGGIEYIRHPQAANGLIAIRKDGTYIYDVLQDQKSERSGSLKVGMMDSPRIYAEDGTSYDQMYSDSASPYLNFDYEVKPFENFRSLGFHVGVGLLYSQGNGRFKGGSSSTGETEARERYTFFAVPLSLGAVLRGQWSDRQWLIPYIAGGGSYIGVAEMRDDGKGPNMVGTPGVYGAGGLLFSVSSMSRESSHILNSEYGIKNLMVGLEYRRLQTFTDDLDFSSNIISAAVTVDY